MNVILIPFFLAANVIVNDTSELWTYGPEYLYDLNITYIINQDPHPVQKIQLISTIKCRPKPPDGLFCHLNNFTKSEFEHRNAIQTATMFEMKFNKRGVENLTIEPPSRMELVNVVRKIATQFNVVVDRGKIDTSRFIVRENSSMGNCATTYAITRKESNANTLGEKDNDFRLAILPLADAKPGTTLSITKIRKGCINSPLYVDFTMGILKMGRFFSQIEISSNKFETFTEFDGKVDKIFESEIDTLSFKELMQINLRSIEPAQHQLPILSYSESIDLNTNNNIPNNFIN